MSEINMIEAVGKYNTAKIFTDNIEETAYGQIIELLNQKAFEDTKIRIMPDTHAGKGCVIGFTSELKGKVIPNLVGVDIGCLDKDSEFLTPNGWKKISEYQDGDKILQYDKESDVSNFIEAINYIVQDCDEFLHFKNSKGLDQMLSGEHKVLVWKGFKSRGYKIEDFRADELADLSEKLDKGYYGVKTAFNIENDGVDLSDNEIRIDVMISADGCIKHSKENEHQIYLHLKKERKIKRAKELLDNCNIDYKETLGKDGSTHIYFFVDKKINKDLSKYWVASQNQLKIIADECLMWDGYSGYRSYFSSNDKSSADVIQFAFTSNNIRAGISEVEYDKENWEKTYVVTPTKNNIIGITNDVSKVKSIDGKKYCFTMPTGYFVARRNGKIFITGNCGMEVTELGDIDIDFEALDEYIRENVPHGHKIHSKIDRIDRSLVDKISKIANKTNTKLDRHLQSLGSLGGGNHFIEINIDSKGKKYLVIHSGSRNLGLQVAKYHQNKAEEYCKKQSDYLKDCFNKAIGILKQKKLEHEIPEVIKYHENLLSNYKVPKALMFLEGLSAEEYLEDMYVAQEFALLSRKHMSRSIVKFLGLNYESLEKFTSTHNYIDPEDKIIRKGATRANKGEKLIIPINMRDGSIIAVGKGNEDWNNSAPHGAGRILSRSKAKEVLSLDEFENTMSDVWTSSVGRSTLDEAPMAYKPIDDILDNIGDTVEVLEVIKPLYNFKASE